MSELLCFFLKINSEKRFCFLQIRIISNLQFVIHILRY